MSVPSPTPAPTGHVVIVEDEALLVLELEDELAAAGHTAAHAPAGAGAAWFRAQVPAAAVVNLGLGPDGDGRGVVRRLRAAFPGLPVVVVTGFGARAPEADLRGLGGPTARVHKPWPRGEVARRLAEAMLWPGHDPAVERRRS